MSLAFEVLGMVLNRGAPVPFRDIIAGEGLMAVRRRMRRGDARARKRRPFQNLRQFRASYQRLEALRGAYLARSGPVSRFAPGLSRLRRGYRGKNVRTARSVLRKLQKRDKNDRRMGNFDVMHD